MMRNFFGLLVVLPIFRVLDVNKFFSVLGCDIFTKLAIWLGFVIFSNLGERNYD
jgi:hypothetical protein